MLVICVTETWAIAKSDIPDSVYTVPGYKILRAGRSDKRGGGVIDCYLNHYLKQHIQESTRPTSDAILDLIFSTVEESSRRMERSRDHAHRNPLLQYVLVETVTKQTGIRCETSYMKYTGMIYRLIHKCLNDGWKQFKNNLLVNVSIPLKRSNP